MFKLRRDTGCHDRLFMGFLTSANQTPAYYLKVFHTASFFTQSQSFIDHPIVYCYIVSSTEITKQTVHEYVDSQ